METRSRKRAEATSHRPSPARPSRSKRARLSASSSAAAASAPIPPRPRPPTRTSIAAAAAAAAARSLEAAPMDPAYDALALASKRESDKASRRESEKAAKRELEKAAKRDQEREEEQRAAEKENEKDRDTDKGKETEAEKEKERARDRDRDRDRDRERERDRAAAAAAAAAVAGFADDDHDGEGGSTLHQNLASASSALHGLLRKLGAGLDDLMPSSTPSSHQNSRLKKILSGLRAEGEEGRQLDALSQLCELLSIGTEESLSSFSVDSFVPLLVGLLNCEYNPDMMLLAARALTHLCDVLPSSCAAVVHYGAVPCFCARLLTIEYIDLAEQSLQALEKISHEHPTACLRAGALIAVLSYLDFFSTGVQRVAVSTAANICRQLPSDASDFVMEAVPILTNLLQYQDSKVVEQASVCLTRIAEAFATSPEKLDTLCSHGLIAQTARLISVGSSSGSLIPQASLGNATYTGLIRLLSTCTSGSAAAAESLLDLRISRILKDILAGSGLVSSTSVSPSSVNRPPEQLYEVVTLINELLPPMPGVPGAATASTSNGGKSAKKHGKSEEGDVTVSEISPREKLLCCQPELLVQFGADLFPVLVQVYGSSVNPPVRHKCLAAINKLLHFSTADMLRTLLKESNISSFLSGVLASKDASVLITALQIAEMLMQKLPDVFTKVFVKEGVVHAIDLLIASEHSQGASQQSSASARGTDASGASTVATSRPRRGAPGRRRGAALTDPADELGGSSSAPVGSPPTGGPEPAFRSARSGLRAAYISTAKRFKEQYFSGDSGLTDAGLTESLCKLKGLSAKLSGDAVVEVKGKGKGKGKASQAPSLSDEQLLGIIQEILVELGGGDGVSTFEFVGSGVVGSLLHFFSCGNLTKENITDPNSARLRQQALKRFKEFIGLALPMVDEGKEVPLTMLVQKLQNALASLERFPVVISHSPRSATSGASIAAGLSALAQPFKLRLCRAPGERVLRDYSSNVVLIEPLATFVAVEDFLWPRVKRHEAVSTSAANSVEAGDAVPATDSAPGTTPSTTAPVVSERRPSTRSRTAAVVASAAATASASASASVSGPAASASVTAGSRRNLEAAGSITSSKGKGKVCTKNTVETPSPEEHRGPETRNAAARRRASAAEASLLKQAEGASSMESEDEEVDASPVELEEAVAMEEDEISEDDEDEEEHEEDDDLDDDQADEEVFGEEPSPVCIGERVHDVQLGDGNDVGNLASSSVTGSEALLQASGFASGISGVNLGGRSNPVGAGAETSGLRTGSSVGAKGSLSFAAVAMAGGTSLGGSGGRGVARDRRTTMASLVAANLPPKLVFSLGGKPLNRSLTIFQAVQRQIVADDEDEERYAGTDAVGTGRRLWEEIYTITYQRADSSTTDQPAASSSGSGSQRLETNSQSRAVNAGSSCAEGSWQQASLLDSILQGELPCDLDKSNTTYNILLLLRVLEGLNRIAPRLRAQQAADAFAEGKVTKFEDIRGYGPLVPREEFLSSKLTPKLARQMQDALALCSGGLPSWCHQLTRACPFLFPFETRRQYFHATAFGLSRALQRLQQQQTADGQAVSTDRELRVGRLQRQKVRVSRNRILDSAAKVMELYSGNKAVLEVEYFGEVGTGLGPTLEFYTLLSHELQKASLDLWRTDIVSNGEDDVEMQDAEGEPVVESPSAGSRGTADSLNIAGDYVQASQGLFPRPWPSNMDTSSNSYAKVVEHFRLLGRVMAKALQDGRLLDLPLSTAFYKLVLGQDLDLYDVKSIDHELGKTLQELQVLVRRKQYLESTPGEKKHAISQLRFRGSRIEDLCLDFTLPGYPDYLLRPNGSEILVDVSNLEDYISLVVDATVKTGILPQMEAFRAGFNQVFQLSSLQIFSEDELDSLLCGRCELWTPDSLSDLIKFDHGYTASSPPIRNLLEIMGEFTAEEQRSFLRFVTGAPRLPPGGLSALSPKLTIVRKHPTGVSTVIPALGTTPPGPVSGLGTTLADGDLPSVMTCANYLKLPPYSSKEVMRERLLYAILEGQGSFDLS